MSAFICFSEGCKTYFHTLKRHDKKEKNENMEKARKAQRKRQRLTNVSLMNNDDITFTIASWNRKINAKRKEPV